MSNKIELTNLSKNSFLGKDLIKKIYSIAYKLEATTVIVKKSRYNKYAEIELHCEDGCIDWNYEVSV